MTTPEPVHRVEAGTVVTIIDGPFAEMSGALAREWTGEDRVSVTLSVFGRPVNVDLEVWSFRCPRWPFEVPMRAGMSLGWLLERVCCGGTDRQLRLFAVACCRRISRLITEDRCAKLIKQEEHGGGVEEFGPWSPRLLEEGVELAERFADGEAIGEETQQASRKTSWLSLVERNYYAGRDSTDGPFDREMSATCEATKAISFATGSNCERNSRSVAAHAARAVYRDKGGDVEDNSDNAIDRDETAAQCDLVRDIFGRPLRLSAADPSWLSSTVLRIAQEIYDERAFDQMPILGDALEDEGCTDEAVLAHLRGTKPHVRGCWVLDLLLGL